MIDRFMLSMAGSGNLSLYYLGQQIYGAANQLLNKSIVAPMVPALSVHHKAGDRAAFLHLYRRKLMQVGLISASGLALWGIAGRTLLVPLVAFGSFSGPDMERLWWIMVWLGGAFLGSSMGQISASSLYASGDTTTPTRLGVITYTLYIPAKIALFYVYGIAGLAVATGLFFISNLLLQNYCISTRHGVG
jgi:putative peptidoglycan lipid II flippase